jgi:similar to stage IV sporulation protein
LRKFKRNTSCKIHITKKVGLPFFIAKNKTRYGFLTGFVICLVILYFMSGCVWNICISGNKNVRSSEIKKSLKEIGVFEGAKISGIDPKEKRNELLLKQSGLSWAAINVEGTKVTVDVTESKQNEEQNTQPSNLLSTQDGIVRKIEVKNGVAAVKVGDTIQKGQLLVSGMIEYSDGSVDFVKSSGSIYAEVDFSITTVQPLKVTESVKTGEVLSRKVLNFFSLEIPLFLGDIKEPYVTYEVEEKISSGNSYLPIKIYTKKFFKTKEITYELTPQRAEARAKKSADETIEKNLKNSETISKKQKISLD